MLLRRLRPPPVEYTPELRWILLRAFGPPGSPFGQPIDSARVVELARIYSLASRIVARQPGRVLRAELGIDSANQLVAIQLTQAVRSRGLVKYIPHLAAHAAELDIPIVFLKFGALYLNGVVEPDARPAVDLDVLVPRDSARLLSDTLCENGFLRRDVGACPVEYHLPPLDSTDRRITIEIHLSVNGLRLDSGGSSPTFESLSADGLLQSIPILPGRCFIPVRDIQLAYLLVHGLAQHGGVPGPGTYPLFRLISDIIDLGADSLQPNLAPPQTLRCVRHHLTGEDVEAAGRLAAELAAGDDSLFPAQEQKRPARVILDHLVAGPIDQEYRNSIALQPLLTAPSDQPRHIHVARRLLAIVFLSRNDLDARYGGPRSEFGYLLLRVFRPIDLLFRIGPRMLVHALRHHRKPS